MIVSLLLTALYLAALIACGWMVTVHVLGIRNVPGAIGMAIALGEALYLFTVNALGYVIPIQIAFWLMLVLMLCTAVFLSIRHRRSTMEWEVPSRGVLFLLGIVIFLAGFAYARDQGSDPWLRTHFPLAAMIRDGYFPIHDPLMGNGDFSYHYGASLLAASFSAITGFSIAVGYALQPLLNAAAIILCATALAWHFLRSWKGAALCGVLAFGGGGLYWLYGIDLARDLWNHFLLQQPIVPEHETAFRWTTHMIRNLVTSPPLMILGHRPIAMGIAFFMAFLYALLQAFEAGGMRTMIAWIITAVVLAAGIALNLETSFGALAGAMVLFAIMRGLDRSTSAVSPSWKRVVIISVAILTPASLIALTQGGVLSSLHADIGASSFAFGFDGRLHFDGSPNEATMAIGSWMFFLYFGFPLMVFPVAAIYFWMRRRESFFPLLLCMVAGVHFLLPVFVRFLPAEHDMNRLFYMGMSVSSLLIGMMLWRTWLQRDRAPWKRISATLCVAAMLLSGALHLPVRLLFPTLRLEASPLFPPMPPTTPAEDQLYAWVRDNTNPQDLLFMRSVGVTPQELLWRMRISTYTGRYVVDKYSTSHPSPEKTEQLNSVDERCDPTSLSRFGIRFIVVHTPEDRAWFAFTCDPTRFREGYSGEALVYEFLPGP